MSAAEANDVEVLIFEDVRLARLARRDPTAADRLLERIHPRVCRVVRAAAGASQDADELVQICLVEILEHLHTYGGTGSLESWAGQVAYRVVMRQLKGLRRRERTFIGTEDEPGVSSLNPERETASSLNLQRLCARLTRISPERRTALVLRLVYEYAVTEVADITGVSVNTVKDRLRTGLRELRVIFAKDPVLKELKLEE
ncbi:MAG: sigma-70 family RNA polymerase sigma factor [Deltaproteobacteria bacterium]|nr:sigma-70 family RNA polymerase sigma factor [Deltaproteobacteria bacterium]